ncbi:MAG: helix-hairpin-helix domain-containing protein [Burkholderiales bacterium]|nr:helix-hairpin-helix domain-containing protein [Burkholderiales bacterium]
MKKMVGLFAGLLLALSAGAGFAQGDKAMNKKPAAETKSSDQTKAKKDDKIDINSATDKELAQLPGIGEARAVAIVKGRPYKGKDELVDKKILGKSVYDKIKDKIIAKQQ